jgi:hypothetical protein
LASHFLGAFLAETKIKKIEATEPKQIARSAR